MLAKHYHNCHSVKRVLSLPLSPSLSLTLSIALCLPVIYELQTEKLVGEFPFSAVSLPASLFFSAIVVLVYALNLVTS